MAVTNTIPSNAKSNRGRPKKEVTEIKHFCSRCSTSASEDNVTDFFYKSDSEYHKRLGKVPLCKKCVIQLSVEEGKLFIEKFKDVLHHIDKPFIISVFNSSIDELHGILSKEKTISKDEVVLENGERLIGTYMKNIAMKQFSGKTWKDSDLENQSVTTYQTQIDAEQEKIYKELREKWGMYQNEILIRFENRHKFLKESYKEKTNMHTEALLKYIKYAILEEIAIENGNQKDAKDWSDLAIKYANNAKINPSQLKAEDLSDGINAFSDYTKSAEKVVDIIPILPQFKFRPNDAVDFVLWNYINYERNLNGMPDCEYSEIYKFYDDKKTRYINDTGDPYNIFKDDPTELNRSKVEQFLKMPDDLSNLDNQDLDEDEESFD